MLQPILRPGSPPIGRLSRQGPRLVDPHRQKCTISRRGVLIFCRPPTQVLRPVAGLGPFNQVLPGSGRISAQIVPVPALKPPVFWSHYKNQIRVHPLIRKAGGEKGEPVRGRIRAAPYEGSFPVSLWPSIPGGVGKGGGIPNLAEVNEIMLTPVPQFDREAQSHSPNERTCERRRSSTSSRESTYNSVSAEHTAR